MPSSCWPCFCCRDAATSRCQTRRCRRRAWIPATPTSSPSIRKMFSRITHLKISSFRWVHSLKGWGWLTGVRFQDGGHPQIYAVLVRDGKILDGHYAVQTDACDTQTYVMFDAMRAARHSKP